MVDPVTQNIALAMPPNNSDIGTWDSPMNNNAVAIDKALGGLVTLNAAGASGITVLALTQYQNSNVVITGTPAGPLTYNLPVGVGRFLFIANATPIGSPSISFGSASGGGVATIPPGSAAGVVIDPTNGGRLINTIAASAGGSSGQIQYNASGALAGDAGLVYNATTDTLTVAGPLVVGGSLALTGNQITPLVVVGAARTVPVALSFAASGMPIDCSTSNVFTLTMLGNITAAPVLSNPGDGQTINIRIQQDATGNRTMAWPSNFRWPGGAPLLSTAANAVDLVVATYFGITGTWLASLLKGFA